MLPSIPGSVFPPTGKIVVDRGNRSVRCIGGCYRLAEHNSYVSAFLHQGGEETVMGAGGQVIRVKVDTL